MSLIKSALADEFKLPVRAIQPGELPFLFATEGSMLHVNGIADITFNVGGLFIAHSVYVVSNISESLILGSEFRSENQLIIDYSNKTVSVCADLDRTQLLNDTDKQRVACITKSVYIPAHSEQIVNIKCSPHFCQSGYFDRSHAFLSIQKICNCAYSAQLTNLVLRWLEF